METATSNTWINFSQSINDTFEWGKEFNKDNLIFQNNSPSFYKTEPSNITNQMDEKINTSIEVQIYSLGENYNKISQKGRARIFYKGLNRNRTYISEEFSNRLLSTIPYTPLKGIWDSEIGDFKDHGDSRVLGKIYGVVMENPNITWERHVDNDGVEREYACADVIIYTEIYPEANQIIGKSLSMELLPSSIQGDWEIIDGIKAYKFTDGAFAGLQALGQNVEPCFEGAAFYELRKSAYDLYQKIIEYEMKNGGTNMSEQKTINFSDEKLNKIWNVLNSEETTNYSIVRISGTDIVALDHSSNEYFTYSYSIEDENVSLGDRTSTYCLFMDGDTNCAFEALRERGSFSEINDNFTTMAADLEAQRLQNSKLTEALSAKEAEFTELNDSIAEKDASIAALTAERDELLEFKCGEQKKKKMSLCEKYALKLEDSVIKDFTANIDNFSYEQLERELAVALVEATPSLFTQSVQMIVKDQPATGIEAILDQYKK